jgi:methionyl-tRNA synthetase
MTSFIKQGLDDLCISRSTFDWGIPVPIDEKHVIYVWLDALTNYITALGYPDEPELYEKYWPANVHLVGKEIVRFHSIIWPAMLMSAGLPLPKQVLGHGWLLLGGEKVSKSKAAKAADVVDPVILIDRYGIDALKYFLLREYTFGQDGVFTNEVMLKRMNYDLANDLGNLVSRTVSMIEKYCGGYVPEANTSDSTDEDLKAVAIGAASKVEEQMDKFSFNMALEEIWILVRRANKYIDEKMPWVLAKEPERKAELDTVMHNLAEAIRIISILIEPFMHTTSKEIRKQMGLWYSEAVWEDSFVFDMMNGEQVKKGNAIFPRLDIEKELSELAKLSTAGEAENIPLKLKPEITYDDFDKIDFRVGTIVKAEKHPKADKLLVFQIKMGTEMRQVISGVAEDFTPQEMEGQKVIVVANLKPRQLRGMESAGMLLFAENGKRCEIVTTKAPDGESVN